MSFKGKNKGTIDLEIYLFSSIDGRTSRLQLHPSQMLETWTSANFRSDCEDPSATVSVLFRFLIILSNVSYQF